MERNRMAQVGMLAHVSFKAAIQDPYNGGGIVHDNPQKQPDIPW